jgi:hypothetical protein
MEKEHAYAEVLRQLSTTDLLNRYYQNQDTVHQVLADKTETQGEVVLTINGVKMSEQDARDYFIMQLVKRAASD